MQLLQFFAAIAAFVIVGVVLTQIIGGQDRGESTGSFGSDGTGTPTEQVGVPADADTQTPEPTPSSSVAAPASTPAAVDPTATLGDASPNPTEAATESVEPTATPDPDSPPSALLRLSLDYATCDDTVIAYGSNFEPGSTISIYGGQLVGDNFGPVVDEYPVADDGSFEVDLDLYRLISECGDGSAPIEGSQYRLGASTGSAQSKSRVDGPSAMTVLTFSRDVPERIKHRAQYQYCGVEVMLTENMLHEAGEPDHVARECFVQAVRIGGYAAEFVSHRQTTDGFIVTTIYRTDGDRNVEVYHDNTRDPVKSDGWTTSTCTGATLGADPFYELNLSGCSQDAAIE